MSHPVRTRGLAVGLATAIIVAAISLGNRPVPDRPMPGPQPVTRDWPMLGGSPSRNLANPFVKNLPVSWNVDEGKRKNVKWVAELGTQTFGGPVISNGRVFIGTNVRPNMLGQITNAVLKAFRETDGKLIWQNSHTYPKEFVYWYGVQGVPSVPAVDGKRIYYIVPANELICASAETGKIFWRYDMAKELKVVAGTGAWCTAPPVGSPLVFGDLVFAFTGNGRDMEGVLKSPKAPSFVAVHKNTGKLVWQYHLPGEKIIEGQWAAPTLAFVSGRPQVVFAGGDSVVYSFQPKTGKLLWKCDCLPLRNKKKDEIDNYFLGAPVAIGTRLFVTMGVIPLRARSPRWSYFLCLDITKSGDVSFKTYEAAAAANRNSALVWAFGGLIKPAPAKGREILMGPTASTPAIHNGLVYVNEEAGYLHCLDEKTGKRCWFHDFKDGTDGSPFFADGKIFIATTDGTVYAFANDRQKKILARIEMDDIARTSPVACNDTLYIATRHRLYAIAQAK